VLSHRFALRVVGVWAEVEVKEQMRHHHPVCRIRRKQLRTDFGETSQRLPTALSVFCFDTLTKLSLRDYVFRGLLSESTST
jgi:hypothetical protein